MKEALTHGGALQAAMLRYGGKREDWLDLSTGINPVPPPLPDFTAEVWTRLPEAELDARAIEAARLCYGAPAKAGVVAAPGSQAFISLLPHLVVPGPAAVLRESYGEHEKALRAAGHDVRMVDHPTEIDADIRLAVIVNPNNPDGRRFKRSELLELADEMDRRGGMLVVDEAFMDADPRQSLAMDAGRPGLCVLRSFGKFFGFAGLRLGFALTYEALAARLRERLGPWAVSGPALHVSANWMADAAVIEEIRVGIRQRAQWTRDAIRAAGLVPQGDALLFSLIETSNAHALFEALARRHILTRPFSYRRDWLRMGQVGSQAEAVRLQSVLRDASGEIQP